MTTLMGIDLSATCTAAIAVPLDWEGKWTRVVWTTAGSGLHRDSSDRARAIRAESIGIAMAEFALGHGVTEAHIESYALGQRTAAHTVAEIGGVVRVYLLQAGVELHTSQMATARKLLLGTVPTKKTLPKGTTVKDVILETLQAAGAPFSGKDDYDVADAYVAANLGLSERGGFALVQAPPPPKPRRRAEEEGTASVAVPLDWANKIDTSGGPDACWLWQGTRDRAGYGRASFTGKTVRVHRLVLEAKLGRRLLTGECALHHCDCPTCVNPKHLFTGTHSDNVADKCAKGRQAKGDRSGLRLHPESRAFGDRNGSRLHPERRPRGDQHYSRLHPEKLCRGEICASVKRSRQKRAGTSSQYLGVCRDKHTVKWVARIRAGELQANGSRKTVHLGRFATEEKAARAYDRAAIEHFVSKGRLCRLNFPEAK